MKNPKTTGWFSREIKPVRAGVYQVFDIECHTILYALWDGEIWGCSHLSPDLAAQHPEFEFAVQGKVWRGLRK